MKYITIIICVLLIGLSFYLPYKYCHCSEHEIIVRDTLYLKDTLIINRPYVVKEFSIKTDTIHVNDTIYIEIPITQKVYEDSLYTAFVSGYNPALDSIFLYQTKEVINNTVYVPKIDNKRPNFSIGIQVGYGTDFQRFNPYMGVGIQYNLFSW